MALACNFLTLAGGPSCQSPPTPLEWMMDLGAPTLTPPASGARTGYTDLCCPVVLVFHDSTTIVSSLFNPLKIGPGSSGGLGVVFPEIFFFFFFSRVARHQIVPHLFPAAASAELCLACPESSLLAQLNWVHGAGRVELMPAVLTCVCRQQSSTALLPTYFTLFLEVKKSIFCLFFILFFSPFHRRPVAWNVFRFSPPAHCARCLTVQHSTVLLNTQQHSQPYRCVCVQ